MSISTTSGRSNATSLEEECQRRLEGGVRRSRHIETLLAELQASSEQQSRGQS